MTIYDSGDLGDTLYKLPTMRALAEKHGPVHLRLGPHRPGLYYQLREQMTPERAALLIPLLRLQPYLASVEFSPTQDPSWLDFNVMRRMHFHPLAELGWNLVDRCAYWYGQPAGLYATAWLTVPRVPQVARYVVNRTQRYPGQLNQIDYAGLVCRHAQDTVFLGTYEEHVAFCNTFGAIPRCHTTNLLEAAQVIQSSTMFIGNQSACFALAEGLKQQAVLEVCPAAPDCYYLRPTCSYRLCF